MEREQTKKPRILVVEDDRSFLSLMGIYIERAGARYDAAADGRSALQMAGCNNYDLILMDMQIPEIDGIMVAHLLKERGYSGALVAMTSLKLENMERNALTVGYNEFIEKPVEYTDIERLIHQYCGAQTHNQ